MRNLIALVLAFACLIPTVLADGAQNAVDDYFGNFTARFGFENDTADVIFTKHAEDFLSEYNGAFNAKLKMQD